MPTYKKESNKELQNQGKSQNQEEVQNHEPQEEVNNQETIQNLAYQETQPMGNETEKKTYSQAELNNPDLIDITISDKRTPIVVLFGPPQCGKTMVMLRLAEYLQNQNGYSFEAVKDYRPHYDTAYKDACVHLKDRLNSKWAAKKNEGMDFMLLKVYYEGSPVVQILEAPGEGYYDPDKPHEHDRDFRPYVQNTIINSPNPKIWVFFTEPDWKEMAQRREYIAKVQLRDIRTRIIKGGRNVIVLFNKIDETPLFTSTGGFNLDSAIDFVNGQYPDMLEEYRNKHFITKYFRPYNCSFIPFQTGTYKEVIDPETNQPRLRYNPTVDEYPASLWNAILEICNKL